MKTVIDCRNDWDRAPEALRALADVMAHTPSNTEEEIAAFESTPIMVAFGDYSVILPTCAASYNFLQYFCEDCAAEFEA